MLCKDNLFLTFSKTLKYTQHPHSTLSSSFSYRQTALLSQQWCYSVSWHRKVFLLVVIGGVFNDLVVVCLGGSLFGEEDKYFFFGFQIYSYVFIANLRFYRTYVVIPDSVVC